MDYAFISEKGEREINEDAVTVVDHNGKLLFVLADGLGGHGHGETASGIVTDTAKKTMINAADNNPDIILKNIFEEAQTTLLERQQSDNDSNSYKTTAVLLAISESMVQWGYIGDSRLYYFHNARLIKHTLDHSVPQMLVNAGKIKESQIRGHEDRNKLLRVLGTEYDSVKYVIESPVIREQRQAFLLCSDGFWEWIDEKKMTKFLKKSNSAQEWLNAMTEEILKNGRGNNMDNYSAIAIIV